MARVTAIGGASRRGERGNALAVTFFFVILLTGLAVAWASYASGSATRSVNERHLDEAAAVGDAAIAFVNEQWRRFPDAAGGGSGYPTAYPKGFLYVTGTETDGWAEITSAHGPGVDAPALGQWFSIGTAGNPRFCLIGIENATVGGGGKIIRILAQYDQLNYTWEACLAQNTTSPIQGVGTQTNQTWSGGTFNSLSGGTGIGTVFANGNISLGTGVSIGGNASAHGTVSGGGAVTGSTTNSAPTITFPDQAAIVNAAEANAASSTINPSSSWWGGTDPKSFLASTLSSATAATRPYMEIAIVGTEPSTGLSAPNPTSWANLAGKQAHLYVKGNGTQTAASTQVLTLPGTTQYAFARLWIDGATVVITAPPGGGTLVMPDIFVTNGGRLILDTSLASGSPPLQILNQGSNQWVSPGISGVFTYNQTTDTWSATAGTGAATDNMYGSTKPWYSNDSVGSPTVKPAQGNGGYDEWQVSNNAFLATITSSPTAEGAIFYNTAGTDFVMNNGGYIMGGIQSSNVSTLETGAMGSAQGLFSTGANAMGWIGWSGGTGSANARFNVNAHGGTAANSGYAGLTYGAYAGAIGSGGSLTGAFVGYSMSVSGTGGVLYDSKLAGLISAGTADTNHALTKRRIADPVAAVLNQIP
jgi:hypothetical protein